MPRRIVVLRHGESVHNAARLWQGQADSDLSETGVAQARASARALALVGVTRVVASDLRRAAETGRAVADAAGVTLELDAAFREISVGLWEGRAHDEVQREDAGLWARLQAYEDVRWGHTGERPSDVLARVGVAGAQLAEELDDGQCAVVATHGLAGPQLAASLLGEDPIALIRERGGLGNARWITLEDAGDGWRLVEWNAGPDPEEA
ncbi:MAG: histidine phosphatase family protein [Thermoleophilia bacterium]|nr:histidine phosphatase family protein [Thermoleophilia bacterium]